MLSLAVGFATRQRLVGWFKCGMAAALLISGLPLLTAPAAHAQKPADEFCGKTKPTLKPKDINFNINGSIPEDSQPNLVVDGTCTVNPGVDYHYGKVNITDGGTLIFKEGADTDLDKVTNFWAQSIIVENKGTMQAGEPNAPYGTNKHTLNIILYGKDLSQGDPINKPAGGDTCVQPNCGVPSTIWDPNGAGNPVSLGNGVTDNFYQYGPVYGTKTGYYGYKVLAVGFGGTLQLHGKKGTSGAVAADADPTKSGTSWTRLVNDLPPGVSGGSMLQLEAGVEDDWQPGDKIVVTTTDYLPSHSEELTISGVKSKTHLYVLEPIKWHHHGKKFDTKTPLGDDAARLIKAGMNSELATAAETRAAVALLTRSIRIVSGGDFAGDYFDCYQQGASKDVWYLPKELSHDKSKDTPVNKYKDTDGVTERPLCATARAGNYSFGGHTAFRQGFQKLQLQGVEFHQMGQGGRTSHYPVHFHMARQVPAETYIKDSSVNESMTRWFVLHSTLGVTLQRNVGWKSIGHGYYLEDGTETDNKFYSNIGILARGAVVGDPTNPRQIPGILAANSAKDPNAGADAFLYRSDVVYPTTFWITNGWNEFVGNMAVGTGTCGTCFWYLPAGNNDHIEVPHSTKQKHMKWSGYAGRQSPGHEGDTPVRLFFKNYCSTSMHSLNTSDGVSPCNHVGARPDKSPDPPDLNFGNMTPIKSIAPTPSGDMDWMYYPNLKGNRYPTVCDPNKDTGDGCTGAYDDGAGYNKPVAKRCNNDDPSTCGITVIDHYTSSFNWAGKNFSAIWLRTPGWFLMDNSFISDVQNAGITFVSGGDYSRSSNPLGYWALLSRSILVGATQPESNSYARASGPHDGDNVACAAKGGNACITVNLGASRDKNVYFDSIGYPLDDWGAGQRLFNIYDGPAHQESNAYLNIKTTKCESSATPPDEWKTCMYYYKAGVRAYLGSEEKPPYKSYLPNAAIAWKQPNGFYYPPAFHSTNLVFKDVEIRHYVVQPLFTPGTYQTDNERSWKEFVGFPGGVNKFGGFTDVDRQTELNDDDGSLTGFKDTISVNEDGFFGAPTQAAQCKSNKGADPAKGCATTAADTPTPPTARTSPYDYVSTVVYPACATRRQGVGEEPFDADPNVKDDRRPYLACGSKIANVPNSNRNTEQEWRGGDWSRDCTGPFCYGVPIYRQYLTGKDGSNNGKDEGTEANSTREWKTWYKNHCGKDWSSKDCQFPFARMAGVNAWQRSIMTVNNGKFYIDTSRTKEFQQKDTALGRAEVIQEDYVECSQRASGNCSPRSVNEFVRSRNVKGQDVDQTYLVFFVFAKKDLKNPQKSTRQIYQIYVGKDFKKSDVKGIKVTDTNIRYKYDDWDKIPWEFDLVAGADGTTKDTLQVMVDFSKVTDEDLDPGTPGTSPKTKANCKPANFCGWNGNTCGCNLSKDDIRAKTLGYKDDGNNNSICATSCKEWAVKDLDCPAGGCLGFSFTLRKGNRLADDKNHRPKPEAYPDKDPFDKSNDPKPSAWQAIQFQKGDGAGDCTYANVPTDSATAQCKVADCGRGESNPPFCTTK